MAGSRIQICNMALGHLRQQEIRDIEERSEAARACRLYYNDSMRAALRSFDWPFARGYARPTRAAIASKPGWAYSFVLPADCLRVREIWRRDRNQPRIPYEVTANMGRVGEGLLLHSNLPRPVVIYTLELLDPETLDASFVQVAAYQLALQLAMPLTGKVALAEVQRKLLAQALATAQVEAANEEPSDFGQDREPDWIMARTMGDGCWPNGRHDDCDDGEDCGGLPNVVVNVDGGELFKDGPGTSPGDSGRLKVKVIVDGGEIL